MVFLSGWWGHASYHEAAPLRYRPSTKDWRTQTRSTSKSVFWCIFWQLICFSVQAVVEPPRKRPRPSKAPWLRRPWVETCGGLCRNTSQRASAMQANNRPRVTRPKTPASGQRQNNAPAAPLQFAGHMQQSMQMLHVAHSSTLRFPRPSSDLITITSKHSNRFWDLWPLPMRPEFWLKSTKNKVMQTCLVYCHGQVRLERPPKEARHMPCTCSFPQDATAAQDQPSLARAARAASRPSIPCFHAR